ncbi:hypothetical protein ACFXDE_21805 [Kitasatospora sp. NPDC059408]|uniref:allene oxide cyclase barrel-like domain-containing protein n=1 Tax=Kitasatospora sp. NPDC059408 TaxID=3346823 RepID=UPI00368D9AD6
MRRIPRKLATLSSVTALVLGTGLVASSGTAAADRGPDQSAGSVPTATCKHIGNLTNVLLWQKVVIPPGTGPQVGTDTIYHDELLDEQGNHVGNSDGRITLVSKRDDGHILGYEDQTLTIDGAVFRTTGLLDVTDLLVNKTWAHLPATWVSGNDKHWIGDWQYRVEAATKAPYLWQASAQLDLCNINTKSPK